MAMVDDKKAKRYLFIFKLLRIKNNKNEIHKMLIICYYIFSFLYCNLLILFNETLLKLWILKSVKN